MIADPTIAHFDCVVPFVSEPHSTSHVEDDDARMMSFDGQESESFMEKRRYFG